MKAHRVLILMPLCNRVTVLLLIVSKKIKSIFHIWNSNEIITSDTYGHSLFFFVSSKEANSEASVCVSWFLNF